MNAVGDAEHRAAVVDDCHQQRATERSEDGAAASRQAAAADHYGRDDSQLFAEAGGGVALFENGELKQARHADEDPRERVDAEAGPGDVQSAQAGGGFAGAEGEDMSAEHAVAQDEGDAQREAERQPDAGRNEQGRVGGERALQVAHPERHGAVGANGGVSGDDPGDALEDGHRAERDDERNDPEETDEQPIERSAEHAGGDAQQDGDCGGVALDKPPGDDGPCERESGSGREVDPAGDDDDGHAEGRDADNRGMDRDRLEVSPGNELASLGTECVETRK